jgi:hypothetical protein
VPRSTTRVAATLAVGLGRLHKSDGCVIGRGVRPPGDILHWVDPSSARRNELEVALAVRALQTPSHALGVLQDGHSECPLGGAVNPSSSGSRLGSGLCSQIAWCSRLQISPNWSSVYSIPSGPFSRFRGFSCEAGGLALVISRRAGGRLRVARDGAEGARGFSREPVV